MGLNIVYRSVNDEELFTFLKKLVWDYLLLINVASFILMGVDKASAIRNGSRIPEKWFFTISMLGGPLGVFLGMLVFHHKTRKACLGLSCTDAHNIRFHPSHFNKTIIDNTGDVLVFPNTYEGLKRVI